MPIRSDWAPLQNFGSGFLLLCNMLSSCIMQYTVCCCVFLPKPNMNLIVCEHRFSLLNGLYCQTAAEIWEMRLCDVLAFRCVVSVLGSEAWL